MILIYARKKNEMAKLISDIRVYKSKIENVDGNSTPESFTNKKLNVILHRIVMKLRESKFSLGEFDHLYLNFTVCLDEGSMQLAKRIIDCYHSWYRWYDIGVSRALFNSLEENECIEEVVSFVEQILLKFFATDSNSVGIIKDSIKVAVNQGENMLMFFKEKKSAKAKADIYLRFLDSARYCPLLCVYDLDGCEILRKDLPETIDLASVGEIQLSSKRVTVKPRKSVFAGGLIPITFEMIKERDNLAPSR